MMKNEVSLDTLLEMVKNLTEKEQSSLAEQIMNMLTESGSKKMRCQDIIAESVPEKPDCPYCAAKSAMGQIVKRGFNKGAQRYYCKSCGRYFVATTNTAFARTRKDAETWKNFIKMTITGRSLPECASECNIAYQTAFTWRHKILNVFAVNQEEMKMTGNIEIDEMFVPLSYKGNHIKGSFGKRSLGTDVINDMPRRGYRRGTDNKPMSPKERACIFCMVQDGNKGYYAAVPGVGYMNDIMLEATVKKHVDKENCRILSDNAQLTRIYLEKNNYTHMILVSNTSDNSHEHKPEVRDGLHIQHVNAMHKHIRAFLGSYLGVSSKYLSNYISLYVWLKTVKNTKMRKSLEQISTNRAAMPDCYITGKALLNRSAVPMSA